MNCFSIISITRLRVAPKKKTEMRAVGVPVKKYAAHAPISTAKIFEQVPIMAVAVPAM